MSAQLQGFVANLAGLPRDLFGERLDTGLGIAAATYTTIIAICFLIGALRSVGELAKAIDVRFDEARLERYNREQSEDVSPRKIDWVLARKQQVRSIWFTIPFGVMVMATLYWWVRESFTLRSYVIIAVCWIVGYMLLRLWWIAMLVYVQRKLVKTGKIEKSKVRWHDMSVPEAIRHYFNWGLQQAVRRRRPFIGILRWLNVFVNLVQLRWVRLSLIKPLLTCAFYAATWPITLPIATFYLNARFDAEDALKPMWASARANEPSKPERTTAV